MYILSTEMIRRNAALSSTYQRGRSYLLQGRVSIVSMTHGGTHIEAFVKGTMRYRVTASFSAEGELEETNCTCPAADRYFGFCKHTVALLLYLLELKNKGTADKYFQKQAVEKLFQGFAVLTEPERGRRLKLEVTYESLHSHNRTYGGRIKLRLGEDRLYIVKNITHLLRCIEQKRELYFGKNFSYDPHLHTFSEHDRRVLTFLREVIELGGSYPEREIDLGTASSKRFFQVMAETPFLVEVSGRSYPVERVVEKELPLSFNLGRAQDNLLLTMKAEEWGGIPLTKDGEYMLVGSEIRQMPPGQARRFKPFFDAVGGQAQGQLYFAKDEQERFLAEVLPHTFKLGQVEISQEVEELIIKADFEAELYLFRAGEGVGAKLKFIYGQRELNPFAPETEVTKDEKILLRDAPKEQLILQLLESYDFKVTPGGLHLEDEDQIFEFLNDGLPHLMEHATIFYSEDFKGLFVRSRSAFSGGIRLNDDNFLEFSFKVEGVDSGELENVFAALEEKKRYFRLHDGSFLSLENSELEQVAELASSLDLSPKDLDKEYVELPKYRAPYLAQKLEDTGLSGFRHNQAFKQLVASIQDPADLDLAAPEKIAPILRDYQHFGFQWLKTLSSLEMGGILADDMGLGKTLQIIALLAAEKEEHGPEPSLVVAPSSLVYNWEAEVEKFAPNLKTLVVSGNKAERREQIAQISGADLVITSYPLIRRDVDDYQNVALRFCILDEAQQIKNAASQGARAVKKLNAKARFALTGTPMENSLSELWSLFDFVLPGYLFSYGRFKKKYESPIVKDRDARASQELSRQIRPFILRRIKKDVLQELPEKIEHQLKAELTNEQKKIYLAYLQQIKGEIQDEIQSRGFAQSQIKILAGLTRLRQICCHPSIFLENYQGQSGKFELLDDIITEAIGGGHRILLFSQFTSMLQLIREHLDQEQIPYLYLDGSTPIQERGAMVRDFNGGVGDLFLISLKAGGTGLNLTGADTVIHFDPWWNPAVEEQATDRAYRIGQDKVVHVMKLITRGTIEEKILALQQKKKALIDSVIQPGQTLLSKLTEEELWEMFAV